jgi:hypothetical protein
MMPFERDDDDPPPCDPRPLDYWVPAEEPIGPPETDPSYKWFSYIAVLISVVAMLVGLALMVVMAYFFFLRPVLGH